MKNISEEKKKRVEKLVNEFPLKKSALIPILHILQEDKGYLSEDELIFAADSLGLNPSYVLSVASFYTMFNRERIGKYHIQVCTNLTCSLLGSEHILAFLENKLGIKNGETTPDGKFTLSSVECLGSCGTAPVMMINDNFYEALNVDRIEEIIKGLK